LYEPIDLSIAADTILTISITDSDKDKLQKSTSSLEAAIIGLIIQLEQLGIFVRPNSQIERQEFTNNAMLFLNVPTTCELNSIDGLVRDFLNQLNGMASSTSLDLSLSPIAKSVSPK
jgi:poly(A) polymerase